MTDFVPRARATGVGSLPHREPRPALRTIARHCPTLPFWPQLPNRDFRENMYAQFSENLAAVNIDFARREIELRR